MAGSFTIEDDGIPGNNTSIIRRDSDGAILATIPHPADALTIRATVPGVNLTFNITDSLGAATISNIGNLQVGGFSADVDGLDVVTSGDIVLTNLGTITLSDETAFDSVHGGDTSGNVTLIANGYDSDITSNVDQSSIIAPRGSIFLTAGRDVSFGLGGADFGNDLRANNNDIVINAGRDLLLSGFADVFANGVLGNTGGGIVVNAGRNVSLLDDTGNSATLSTLGSNGGAVVVTTGPNGAFTLEVPSTNGVFTAASDVIVNADRIIIASTSSITAPGDVTLRPVSEGRAILLGSLSDSAAALELSDGELDRIFTSGALIVGGDASGPITVGAPISPGGASNFTLRSGSDIFANFSLTAADKLSLFAGDICTWWAARRSPRPRSTRSSTRSATTTGRAVPGSCWARSRRPT